VKGPFEQCGDKTDKKIAFRDQLACHYMLLRLSSLVYFERLVEAGAILD
jgi:hypothetical protein